MDDDKGDWLHEVARDKRLDSQESCETCAHHIPCSLGKPGPLANYKCAVFGPLHYCDEWKEKSMDHPVECPCCKRTWQEYGCEQHACIELYGECMACRTQNGWRGTDVEDIVAKSREMKAARPERSMFERTMDVLQTVEIPAFITASKSMLKYERALSDLHWNAPPEPPLTAHQTNDLNKQVEVIPVGKRGPGGAFNRYHVQMDGMFYVVPFMNGFSPAPNGLSHEILLAILIDRLEGFQAGEYACRENALALTKLQEALFWLNHRTREREARGVENTPEK